MTPFPTELHVVVSEDVGELNNVLLEWYDVEEEPFGDSDEALQMITSRDGEVVFLILCQLIPGGIIPVGTMSHEVGHVIFDMKAYYGLESSKEYEGHYMSYFMDEIMSADDWWVYED